MTTAAPQSVQSGVTAGVIVVGLLASLLVRRSRGAAAIQRQVDQDRI